MAGPLTERVTKLDAARRQLRTAIRMFFEDGDSVSIHTLAAAAQGVLRNLLTSSGKKSPIRETEEDWIKPEHWKEYLALVNAPQNFFKHADRDPDEVFEFRSEVTPVSLLECVIMYQMLTGRMLREGYVFFVWLILNYPDWIKEGTWKDSVMQARIQLGPTPTRATFRQILYRGDLFPNTD